MNREALFQFAEALSISSNGYPGDAFMHLPLNTLIYVLKSIAIVSGIHWLCESYMPVHSAHILITATVIWIGLSVLLANSIIRKVAAINALNTSMVFAVKVLADNQMLDKHAKAAMILYDAIRELSDSVVKLSNNKHAEWQTFMCLAYLDSEFSLDYWATSEDWQWRINHPVKSI